MCRLCDNLRFQKTLKLCKKHRRESWLCMQPYFGILLDNPVYEHYYANRETPKSNVGKRIPMPSYARPKWRDSIVDVLFEADQLRKSIHYARDYYKDFFANSDDLVYYQLELQHCERIGADFSYGKSTKRFPIDKVLKEPECVDLYQNTYFNYVGLFDEYIPRSPTSESGNGYNNDTNSKQGLHDCYIHHPNLECCKGEVRAKLTSGPEITTTKDVHFEKSSSFTSAVEKVLKEKNTRQDVESSPCPNQNNANSNQSKFNQESRKMPDDVNATNGASYKHNGQCPDCFMRGKLASELSKSTTDEPVASAKITNATKPRDYVDFGLDDSQSSVTVSNTPVVVSDKILIGKTANDEAGFQLDSNYSDCVIHNPNMRRKPKVTIDLASADSSNSTGINNASERSKNKMATANSESARGQSVAGPSKPHTQFMFSEPGERKEIPIDMKPFIPMNKVMTPSAKKDKPDMVGFSENLYGPIFYPDGNYTYTHRNHCSNITEFCKELAEVDDVVHKYIRAPHLPKNDESLPLSARSDVSGTKHHRKPNRLPKVAEYEPEMTFKEFRKKMPGLGERLWADVYQSYRNQEFQEKVTKQEPLYSNVRSLVPFIEDGAVKFAYLAYKEKQNQTRRNMSSQTGSSVYKCM